MRSKFYKCFGSLLVASLMVSSCTEDPLQPIGSSNIVLVTTNSASSISQTSALSGGSIEDGGNDIISRGVCWSTSINPTINNTKTSNGSGSGSFNSSLTGLSAGTIYYVRAYATTQYETIYGNEVQFTSSSISLPLLTTTTISNITINSASSGGNVTSAGGGAISARGVCWSTSTNPTINNSKTSNGTGTGSFSSSITGLNYSTTYYVRAYATNQNGTAYGTQQQFTTSAVSLATISTTSISSIARTTAAGGGNVTSAGGGTVDERGICWNTSTNPTILNSRTINGTGTGSFSSSITGLTANTTYFVRAYSSNEAGTSYGAVQSFKTLP